MLTMIGKSFAAGCVALILVGLSAAPTAHGNGGFQLIVHPSNPVDSLPSERVSAIFRKKISRWENGKRTLPVDQAPKSKVRENFSNAIHGKSVSAIKSYWQREVFAGREVPPPQKASDAEVIAYVASHPDAIGYVSTNASTSKVKTISVTD